MFLLQQDLIDFCKDIGLQSSAAATRNATIKLIGVLHKFVGPGDFSVFKSSLWVCLLAMSKMQLTAFQISRDSYRT